MRALVLSGGGSKGAFQVGAISHLLGELELTYDIFTGISVGALNGAHLAMYPAGSELLSVNHLVDVWNSISDTKVFTSRYPGLGSTLSLILSALSTKSLYSTAPLRSLVQKLLLPDKLLTSGKLLSVGAVSLNSGEVRYWNQDSSDIVQAVLASSAFPGFFEPVDIDGDVWTDGGVRDIAPIQRAMDLGATEVDVVITSPVGLSRIDAGGRTVVGIAKRIVDAMSEEIVETDVLLGKELAEEEGITVRILRPSVVIQSNSLDFSQEKIQENIQHGLQQARKVDWHG